MVKSLLNVAAFANTPPKLAQVYLSASQLAIRLGLSRTTIWRYLKNDPAFPQPLKFGKTTRRWCLDEVKEWETSHSN